MVPFTYTVYFTTSLTDSLSWDSLRVPRLSYYMFGILENYHCWRFHALAWCRASKIVALVIFCTKCTMSIFRTRIYAHYLSISAHLKCVASEDDWYLCKNISMSFALCQKILICIAVVVVVVAVIVVTYLHKWCHVIIGLATTRNNTAVQRQLV